jgi:hypothetical protein
MYFVALHTVNKAPLDEVIREYASVFGLHIGEAAASQANFHSLFDAARRVGQIPLGIDEEMSRRMFKMASHSSYLARDFQPNRFDGSLLFFEAAKKQTDQASPQSWSAYITG